ncbi:putative signaling protein [Nymphon striatum]|nr:putative signaling protein [Nymphon striatum]
MPGHSSVLSLLGVIILAVSWIGFNAGTAAPGSFVFTQIVVNTIVALCFGGAAALIYDLIANPRAMQPRTSASGILGGLVSITAGCAYVDFFGAVVLGFGGGMAATIASELFLKKAKLDDPVDAIATHLVAGFFGTTMLAFIALPEFVTTTRLEMFLVQLAGSTLALVWAFGMMFGAIKIISLFMAVRVSAEEEQIGLNLSEHNASFDSEQLTSIVRDMNELNLPAPAMSTELISENPGATQEQDVSVINTLLKANTNVRDALQEKEDRFDDYEKVGTDWLWETDADHKVSFVSKRLLREVDTSLEDHKATLDAHEIFDDILFTVLGFDRTVRIFSISGIPRFDVHGNFQGYRGRSLDVTEKMKADEEIRYLAHHDHLTGLANRHAFHTLMSKKLNNGDFAKNGAAVLSMDLDGFKAVNDSFGHHIGDELLCALAKRIRAVFGEDSAIARFGGDEFVIGFALEPHGLQIRVGVSIGSSRFPSDSTNIDDLVRFSDMALYEAKGEKRGQWLPFSSNMQEMLERRKKLENDMRAGIEKNEFYAVYQPQIDMVEKRLTGFEALIRWHHPTLGELSPNEFIRIAEDTGLIAQLGHFMLSEACKTAATWPNLGDEELKISVNVSPQQFFNQDLLKIVKQTLEQTGLKPSRLEIEITEGTLVRDSDEAIRILTSLREFGIRIAVDDFANPNDRRITHAIVDLGRSLGLNVIAEGVETKEQFSQLSDMMCDEMQGFLLSPPVSALQSMSLIEKALTGDLSFEENQIDTTTAQSV